MLCEITQPAQGDSAAGYWVGNSEAAAWRSHGQHVKNEYCCPPINFIPIKWGQAQSSLRATVHWTPGQEAELWPPGTTQPSPLGFVKVLCGQRNLADVIKDLGGQRASRIIQGHPKNSQASSWQEGGKGRVGEKQCQSVDVSERREQPPLCWLWGWRGEPWAKACRRPLGPGKAGMFS